MTPQSPFLKARGEKNLELGSGEDHRAHIAAVGNQPRGDGERPLALQKGRPYRRKRGHLRGIVAGPLGTDVTGDLLAPEPDRLLTVESRAEPYVECRSHPGQSRGVVERR